MSLPYPDARTWARDQSLANAPRLGRLESVAFQAHPDIVASFGADGASLASVLRTAGRRTPARRLGGVALVAVGILLLLAPAIGVAIYGDAPAYVAPTAEPFPAELAVPISGICFTVAALTQLILAIGWLRGGARYSLPLAVLAGANAVLAGFAAFGLPNVAARDDYPLGAWMIPVWATIVLGGLLALGIVLRRRAAPDEPVPAPLPAAPTVSDGDRARILVAGLTHDERVAIRGDRDDALQILAERGLIDDDLRARATAADLGTLFTLDATHPGAT
ncbi:hypothetical protein N3K63_01125 [Microbacterium sp. W1N]|uniref:hypothetical protein n=1 Tax=Microbacterium festucae TaxID=2977531 RepID=UPI0021C0F8AE|nr:hypothetical protein [Microbacterium festucae]MCT9818880.1 hypothetical protein [Microbacterium festucae]